MKTRDALRLIRKRNDCMTGDLGDLGDGRYSKVGNLMKQQLQRKGTRDYVYANKCIMHHHFLESTLSAKAMKLTSGVHT